MPDARAEARAAAAWWAGALGAGAEVDAARAAAFEHALAQRIEALCQNAGWSLTSPPMAPVGGR